MKRPLPHPKRRPIGQFLKRGRPTGTELGHQDPRTSPAMAQLMRKLAGIHSMENDR